MEGDASTTSHRVHQCISETKQLLGDVGFVSLYSHEASCNSFVPNIVTGYCALSTIHSKVELLQTTKSLRLWIS